MQLRYIQLLLINTDFQIHNEVNFIQMREDVSLCNINLN